MKCPYCNGTGAVSPKDVHVGLMISAARLAKGMTQDELASQVGISRAQVANIESGRSDTTVRVLTRFAHALGSTLRDLMP